MPEFGLEGHKVVQTGLKLCNSDVPPCYHLYEAMLKTKYPNVELAKLAFDMAPLKRDTNARSALNAAKRSWTRNSTRYHEPHLTNDPTSEVTAMIERELDETSRYGKLTTWLRWQAAFLKVLAYMEGTEITYCVTGDEPMPQVVLPDYPYSKWFQIFD
jgi:hypothetical protein